MTRGKGKQSGLSSMFCYLWANHWRTVWVQNGRHQSVQQFPLLKLFPGSSGLHTSNATQSLLFQHKPLKGVEQKDAKVSGIKTRWAQKQTRRPAETRGACYSFSSWHIKTVPGTKFSHHSTLFYLKEPQIFILLFGLSSETKQSN